MATIFFSSLNRFNASTNGLCQIQRLYRNLMWKLKNIGSVYPPLTREVPSINEKIHKIHLESSLRDFHNVCDWLASAFDCLYDMGQK